MTAEILEDRIAGIESKLDFIVEELGHMKRVRNEAEDLVADLTLVAKDAFGEITSTCSGIDFRPKEISELLKSGLRDVSLLTATLHQLESAADLFQDVQPIVRDLYQKALAGCVTLEQKGYLDAAAAGMRIGDTLVTSHSPDDLKQIERSVPHLVGFLRELTRPEALQALEAIIHGFGRVQATMNADKSVFELMRDLKSTEARRGMAMLVEFLKVVGSRNGASDAVDAQIGKR